MEDTGYNGWTNYPTWCVNLWLSNDEGLYELTLERTKLARERAESMESPVRPIVADEIRELVDGGEDAGIDDLAVSSGFASDLLGYALDQVNWDEIADAWIEQVEEQAV